MDSTVLAAVIGGVATVGAAVIATLLPKYLEARNFAPINADRRAILQGTWRGSVSQIVPDGTFRTLEVDLILSVKGKTVKGTGVMNAGQLYHVTLGGSFRNDRFLKMDYHNKTSHILQFGCFIFSLGEGDVPELVGRFVGYGFKSKSIVFGDCEFKRTHL